MFKKFISLPNLTLIVALSLSTIAAYYSIIGLTAIFAGAVIPVIVMGSMLEVAKITTTVWLRKYWKYCSWVLKLYLVPAVVALALLTSMGIFGFLSKAHMDQGLTSGDVQAKLSLLDEKIKTQRENIELARKALTQMDNQVDQRLSRGDSENSAERAVVIRRQQAGERAKLQKDIGDAQKEIQQLNEERAPIAAENRKVEAEVGPIKYIAALIYGDNADANMLEAAVRWVIILLVIVFDPLAIALVLAANASKEWKIEEPEEKADELDPSATDTVESPVAEEVETIEETVPEPEPVIQEPEIDRHAYLKKKFVHFKTHKPLVYIPPVEVPVEPEAPAEPIEPAPKKVRKPRLKKSPKTEPVVEPVVDETPELERPEDYSVPSDTDVAVLPKKPYHDIDGTYVMFEGRHMNKDVLKNEHPELFTIKADTEFNTPVNTSFGIKFPETAKKGDVFVRVDMLPNRVYKQDGNGRWIEVNKNNSDTYLSNSKYVEYLIEKLDQGQYDPELLSDSEKEQIERHIKATKKVDN